jgi:hypothetical protein
MLPKTPNLARVTPPREKQTKMPNPIRVQGKTTPKAKANQTIIDSPKPNSNPNLEPNLELTGKEHGHYTRKRSERKIRNLDV